MLYFCIDSKHSSSPAYAKEHFKWMANCSTPYHQSQRQLRRAAWPFDYQYDFGANPANMVTDKAATLGCPHWVLDGSRYRSLQYRFSGKSSAAGTLLGMLELN